MRRHLGRIIAPTMTAARRTQHRPGDVAQPVKRSAGRPSSYSDERALAVLTRIALGHNILAICAEQGMPAWTTLCRWKHQHPDFATAYARAREASAEVFEARVIAAAESATPENHAAVRVLVDVLRWAAAKRWPRAYGDRLDTSMTVEHGLADRLGAAIRRTRGQTVDMAPGTGDNATAVVRLSAREGA